MDELSRDNVLLLSGTPRVGKTYAARWIAAEFTPLGYDVQEFADVDSAERFLLDPGTAPRLNNASSTMPEMRIVRPENRRSVRGTGPTSVLAGSASKTREAGLTRGGIGRLRPTLKPACLPESVWWSQAEGNQYPKTSAFAVTCSSHHCP